MSMLEVEDFGIAVVASRAEPGRWLPWPRLQDTKAQENLTQLCIVKARLCISIGRMLREGYTMASSRTIGCERPKGNAMMLFPREKPDGDRIALLDRELDSWLASLPECYQINSRNAEDVVSQGKGVAVQRGMLYVVYFVAVLALHRPYSGSPPALHDTSEIIAI